MNFRLTPVATLVLFGFPLLGAPSLEAQQVASASDRLDRRSVEIPRSAGPVEIDAELDDPGWSGAADITGFVERTPREGSEPPVETEVLLTYDESDLYVAFIASDPDVESIRAALQPRDQLWNDDWVGLLLDPYGDGSFGYYFLSNPLGIQADLQMTPRSEDSSIDFVHETAGRITDEGYVVEMRIPFASLRMPAREARNWGIMFVRTYPRSNRHYITWPSWSRNEPCQLCALAALDGIEGIQRGGDLEVLPSLVVSRGGELRDGTDPGTFESGSVRTQPSLGLKYALDREWTAEATLNPDFSQVESDAAQVDVNSTFALFFPERRPFFQEGMDLYQTPLNVFYSRSINAPRAATKLTGRAGRTSVGYIGAWDEHTPFFVPFEEETATLQKGESFTNVLRLRHNLGGASHLGGLVTDRRLEGGSSGTTAGVDGAYRFDEVHRITGQLVLSYTREPDDPDASTALPDLTFADGEYSAAFDGESFAGHAASLYLARDARTWSWNALYMQISPTYRADVGFQTQNNFRRATGWTGLTFYPNRPFLERVSGSLFGGSYWNFEGVRIQDVFSPQVGFTLPRQTNVHLATTFRNEVFRGVHLTGIREHSISLNSNFSAAFQGEVTLGAGRRVARTLAVPEVGDGRNASISATVRPTRRLVIEPSLTYRELRLPDGTEVFSGYIARSRIGFQYNRELNLRVVFQHDEFSDRMDVEPLLVYQLNPFTIFYVGSTHGYSRFDEEGFVQSERQLFAKFQYLFR